MLDIVRRGLKIRKDLRLLKLTEFDVTIIGKYVVTTIIKSNIFQASLR